MTDERFLAVLKKILGPRPWPRPLHLLQGRELVLKGGRSLTDAARDIGTTQNRLRAVMAGGGAVAETLGVAPTELTDEDTRRARLILAQLLLGRCAEVAFEDLYRSEMVGQEFDLVDLRESRTDTDYRLVNGNQRPIFRINIKFFGSQFRRSTELVGLATDDTFALATYKIFSALQKQDLETLPYLFVIVGVANLRAEDLAVDLPDDLACAVALYSKSSRTHGKRDFEDAAVEYLISAGHPIFVETLARIRSAAWFVLSARRADRLLREKLFERVYALRIRGFARQFRAAELDMHFSLTADLLPLPRFLRTLRDEGIQKVTAQTERGDV